MLSNAVVDEQAQQQLLALRQANRVRVARAELKRKVARDEVSVAQVVLDCPWEAASMEIGDLIRSQRRWGAARCRRLLVSVGLPENKHVGTLTDRQRKVLAAVLDTAPESRAAPPSTLGPPPTSAPGHELSAV
ncbi:MAG TPA: hypothetical protein VGR12_03540 [Solirubrobacteraceae bacterium]|nr:hypothetical protein [Solirubrobacteraceae bacterium]